MDVDKCEARLDVLSIDGVLAWGRKLILSEVYSDVMLTVFLVDQYWLL